jgi:hypothetical protein
MNRLRWTKFQDFYLRLGFLKVLVALISAERRSVPNDAIIRRLNKPLFDEADKHPDLSASIAPFMDRHGVSVAEALLVQGDCPSLLFAITGPTSYKILDWARDIDFIGRGNQVSERGLLLRNLIDESAANKFAAGDVSAWNPFVLSTIEKLYFLYHLAEIDQIMVELIRDLGELSPETERPIETRDAARLTCRAFLRVLRAEQNTVNPRDILKFRTACALAVTIAKELDIAEEASELIISSRRKLPKPVNPRSRSKQSRAARQTTKNADHQTIPRFEQLVDLGFLYKPTSGEAEQLNERRRWLYIPTDACRRWANALRQIEKSETPFLWHSFAKTSIAAFNLKSKNPPEIERSRLILEYVWKAYEQIHRRAGVNPLDSVALFAMVTAAANGIAIEMAEIHRIMLAIKQQNLCPDHAFFASGNNLDQMFIQLKPGFLERAEQSSALLSELV